MVKMFKIHWNKKGRIFIDQCVQGTSISSMTTKFKNSGRNYRYTICHEDLNVFIEYKRKQ